MLMNIIDSRVTWWSRLPKSFGLSIKIMRRARYLSTTIPRCKVIPRRSYASRVAPLPAQITTLDNKLRVATESTPGHFSAVGVYIDAGSRYEAPQFTGVSHILDRMAFKVSPSTNLGFTYRRYKVS